jgi:hypothetical protein
MNSKLIFQKDENGADELLSVEWVAQVSLLRPGFLGDQGCYRNTQVSKARPGPPTLCVELILSGGCNFISDGANHGACGSFPASVEAGWPLRMRGMFEHMLYLELSDAGG